ncbi:hypothetical protein NBRC3299_0288 [Acetobacter pasteurianus NBRC 3299]|nr:hypothetical protein BBA71_06360 [Acetobacter pasteurianus]GCD73996.1 hypothetical protein NBRC3299_0288 [Acetobacter pasteurianus NBRC 3299]
MADKDGMERRVYLLPEELVDRIKAYQSANGIPYEVEAVRRLLNDALQSRDTIDNIMRLISDYFKKDSDLRSIASSVLSSHILVTQINISDQSLKFGLRNGDAGEVTRKGNLRVGTINDEGWIHINRDWHDVEPPKSKKTTHPPELDDEIPF